jgi:hypothetical protein
MTIRQIQIPTYCRTAILTSAFLLFCLTTGVVRGADEAERECKMQAAVIVAEMRAQAEKPLSDEAVSLARKAALRGCLAKTRRTLRDDTPEVQQDSTATAAPQPKNSSDSSFWDRFFGPGIKHSERVKGRRRHY